MNNVKMLIVIFKAKNSVEKSRFRWQNIIEVDLKEISCKYLDYVELGIKYRRYFDKGHEDSSPINVFLLVAKFWLFRKGYSA